jgi:hypothetical protein
MPTGPVTTNRSPRITSTDIAEMRRGSARDQVRAARRAKAAARGAASAVARTAAMMRGRIAPGTGPPGR